MACGSGVKDVSPWAPRTQSRPFSPGTKETALSICYKAPSVHADQTPPNNTQSSPPMTLPEPPPQGAKPPSPSHHPANTYTSGLPAPPRILIPPHALEEYHLLSQHPALSSLTSVPAHQAAHQDWRYESRREAQQLLPHLYLGPLSAARDTAFLQRNNITLLFAIRSNMTARAKLLHPTLPGVRYESLDVSSSSELITKFQLASEVIDSHFLAQLYPEEHRSNFSIPIDGWKLRALQDSWARNHGQEETPPVGGKTLLFCESGNERSAAVAASYIMQHLSGSAVQAIQMVQGKRFCVCYDDATKWMLASYEPIWMARRQSQQSLERKEESGGGGDGDGGGGDGGDGGGGGGGGGGNGKRRLEEDDDDEVAGEGAVTGRAPFLDSEADVEMV